MTDTLPRGCVKRCAKCKRGVRTARLVCSACDSAHSLRCYWTRGAGVRVASAEFDAFMAARVERYRQQLEESGRLDYADPTLPRAEDFAAAS